MIFDIDIGKYFDWRNKNKDLSDRFRAEKNQKTQQEQTPNVSCSEDPTLQGDLFEESLKSDDCIQMLINCLKNLEKEIKELHSLAK